MIRVGQNHNIYVVYIWCFWQGSHQLFGRKGSGQPYAWYLGLANHTPCMTDEILMKLHRASQACTYTLYDCVLEDFLALTSVTILTVHTHCCGQTSDELFNLLSCDHASWTWPSDQQEAVYLTKLAPQPSFRALCSCSARVTEQRGGSTACLPGPCASTCRWFSTIKRCVQ